MNFRTPKIKKLPKSLWSENTPHMKKLMGTNVALNSSPMLEVITPWNSAVIIGSKLC